MLCLAWNMPKKSHFTTDFIAFVVFRASVWAFCNEVLRKSPSRGNCKVFSVEFPPSPSACLTSAEHMRTGTS